MYHRLSHLFQACEAVSFSFWPPQFTACLCCLGLQHVHLWRACWKPAERLCPDMKHGTPARWAPSGTAHASGGHSYLSLAVRLLEDTLAVVDKLRICGPWGDGVESQSLGHCGLVGVSYREMRSGTAQLQPILWMLRSAISEDVLLQKCRSAPLFGVQRGEGRERMK